MDKSWGKFYAKTFTGSMFGAGLNVFAVWGYAIANARPPEGDVELNPKLLSALLGGTEEDVKKAIEYLSQPDKDSRSPNHYGKRIIKISQFNYKLVNFVEHRAGAGEEERKRYHREKQRLYRSRLYVKRDVSDSIATIPQAEAEAEAEKKTTSSSKRPTPPKDFLTYWTAYPKKIGKQAALRAWLIAAKKGILPPIDQILKALETQKNDDQWCKDGGQYIPHPTTWINQGRWDDQPIPWQEKVRMTK